MIMNMRYVWLCIYCIAVCAGHAVNKKLSSYDFVTGLMEQSAQLRVELDDLKQKYKTLEETVTEQRTVAFCASGIGNTSPGVGDTILFNNIELNEGATYHPSTGMFVAVYPGLYQFSVHFCNAENGYAVVGIKKNEAVLVTSTTKATAGGNGCNTVVRNIVLEAGDTVTVINPQSGTNYLENANRENQFCGHRIGDVVNN